MRPLLTTAAIIAAIAVAIAVTLISFASESSHIPLPRHLNLTIGICTHGNKSSEILALSSGVKYMRTDISLSQAQENLLDFEHSNYGANYLGILDYATVKGDNWNLSQWNASVAQAVADYPWITAWEIWNEPLVSPFQTGYMNGSPYNYYEVIKSAYAIIKAKEPNATIVCFGGAPIANQYAYYWYAQVWAYGASNYCNAISIHAYPQAAGPLNSSGKREWMESLNEYESLTGKPIWITEFGVPSSSALIPGYTPKLQEEFLASSLTLFNSMSFVKRVYWYDLWGLSDGELGNNFGLLNLSNPSSGTPSPAWGAFLYAYFNSTSNA
ncbi:MAG: glycosyl hydrolase [Candidatus Micrarchaeaceae archaeon]